MKSLRKLVRDTWCWRFINTKPGKYIKFFTLLLIDMINLIVDWYFYAKVQLIQPGLVYGPPDMSVKLATLVFCIISVFGFLIETIQNADDLLAKRKLPCLSQSITNFILIVFEDFPLLVLNMVVTTCRDGEPTVISVVKASVCIGIVVIRLFLMLMYYWFFEEKKTRVNVVFDICSTIGLVVVGSLSIAIQLLNNFPTNAHGLIQTADPAKFDRMTYATDKYLKQVGIYSRWPIDEGMFVGNTSTSQRREDFIYLGDITEVIDHNYLSISIRTDYTISSENFTLCITKLRRQTCYLVRNSTFSTEIDPGSVDFSAGSFMANNGFDFAFTKEPAQEYKYLIGYIDYNLNKFSMSNGAAEPYCSPVTASSLIYAKFLDMSDLKANSYLRNNSMGYSFFNLNSDLVTVDRIWRTGVVRCKMSGDIGPKLSRDIHLNC